MNKKIIVSTLALAMGAALAGSVSGTVAWFQYSTRAQAAFIGTTAHCSEALEIKANAVGATASATGFSTELTASQVASACELTGTAIEPITYGAALAADDALTVSNFKRNPIYQHFDYDEWIAADNTNYYQFELNFRVKDIDGESTATYLSKDLYLIDLDIVSLDANDALDTHDLYKAVRVHINCGDNNLLFANNGDETKTTVTTALGAQMDLNNDGKVDTTEGYEWNPGSTEAYGDDSLEQVANNTEGYSFADDSDPSDIDGTALGTILANEKGGLKVTVTMWLEGWQELSENPDGNAATPANNTAVKLWDPEVYVGAKFAVGFRFACDAHVAH